MDRIGPQESSTCAFLPDNLPEAVDSKAFVEEFFRLSTLEEGVKTEESMQMLEELCQKGFEIDSDQKVQGADGLWPALSKDGVTTLAVGKHTGHPQSCSSYVESSTLKDYLESVSGKHLADSF